MILKVEMTVMILRTGAAASGLLLVRRHGPTGGLFPENSTPTARRRFRKKGWKGARWKEEVKAVNLRCLALRSVGSFKSCVLLKV